MRIHGAPTHSTARSGHSEAAGVRDLIGNVCAFFEDLNLHTRRHGMPASCLACQGLESLVLVGHLKVQAVSVIGAHALRRVLQRLGSDC